MAQITQYLIWVVTLVAIPSSPDYRVGLVGVEGTAVGVNWGRNASHPLPPSKVVELLKANNVTRVRLYDADPSVLEALSGSRIQAMVGIPNSMLHSFNSSLKAAQSWVHNNLTRYFSNGSSKIRIQYVLLAFFPVSISVANFLGSCAWVGYFEGQVYVIPDERGALFLVKLCFMTYA